MNTNIEFLNKEANSPMQKAEALIELETIKKQIEEKIVAYREQLLEATKELDVLSLKTGTYTISRVKKLYPKVIDFEQVKTSLEKENIPYDVVETFADHMKETFKQIAEDGKQIDGLEISESEYIMVRINKE